MVCLKRGWKGRRSGLRIKLSRVKFNDTLNSTFEYPSEASLIVEPQSDEHDHYVNVDTLNFENLTLDDTLNAESSSSTSSSPRHHHHVAVDEIIQLPTPNSAAAATATAAAAAALVVSPPNTRNNILGNLPLDII